jgi:hypothetical protein
MYVFLELNNWDGALEATKRILVADANNIDAHKLILMYDLCREGNYKSATNKLSKILQVSLNRLQISIFPRAFPQPWS